MVSLEHNFDEKSFLIMIQEMPVLVANLQNYRKSWYGMDDKMTLKKWRGTKGVRPPAVVLTGGKAGERHAII